MVRGSKASLRPLVLAQASEWSQSVKRLRSKVQAHGGSLDFLSHPSIQPMYGKRVGMMHETCFDQYKRVG